MQPYGLIATFETPGELFHAAEHVRDAGYRNWDCISPLPIHGSDKAGGLGVRSFRGFPSAAASPASAPG